VNKKKQKRRQKAAAKLAANQNDEPLPTMHSSSKHGIVIPAIAKVHVPVGHRKVYTGPPPQDDDDYSDSDDDSYDVVPPLSTNGHAVNPADPNGSAKKKSKKKKKSKGLSADPYSSYPQPPSSGHISSSSVPPEDRGRIWNTSTQEERETNVRRRRRRASKCEQSTPTYRARSIDDCMVCFIVNLNEG